MALLEHLTATLRRWENDTSADIDAALGEIRVDLMSFLAGLKTALARNPEPVFAILRKIKPILVVDNFALVTRFDDVQEVLARDEIFQVTYGPKMQVITASSNFFLGMQNTLRLHARRLEHADRCAPRRCGQPDRPLRKPHGLGCGVEIGRPDGCGAATDARGSDAFG